MKRKEIETQNKIKEKIRKKNIKEKENKVKLSPSFTILTHRKANRHILSTIDTKYGGLFPRWNDFMFH